MSARIDLAQEPAAPGGRVPGIGRAAILIGGLTVVARVLGFVRTLVFAGTVKTSCLSAAYVTANQVPNVIYDIVLGGALTAIVVPVLAGPADRSASSGEADPEASAISSALLTWTIVILAPVSLVLALVAGPVISALMPANPGSGCAGASLVPIAAGMLEVFAPQILLYGLAVVLYGILQAHRKFTAPALAPILSSVVVIVAYGLFVPLGRQHTTHVAGLPPAAELTLSAGTTLGVAALMLTALGPVLRLRLGLRPALRFPEGIARRARSLAGVGVAALVAQDASVLVVTRLANARGGSNGSAVAVYSYGWQAFVSVYAVLAIPIAISAFPVLAARKGAAFDAASASATRATALASCLGAALLGGVAVPVARAFPELSPAVASQFALALAAFAPGLVGYGLTACLSRVLLADGRNRAAVIGLVGGWLVVIGVDAAVVPMVPASSVVPVLGLANTVGMTVSGVALLVAVGRTRGAAALRGSLRAIGAGLAGAVAGAAAGLVLTAAVPVVGHWPNAGLALAAGICAGVAFCAVVAVVDGGDLRSVLHQVRRRGGFGGSSPRVSTAGGGAVTLRVGIVVGTTAGGAGRHAAMLAGACADAGALVRVFGPAPTRALLPADRMGAIGFGTVTITDRPRPVGDARAVLRLRRLLDAMRPDVVHAHGLRAGAFAALALAPGGRRRPALVVTVHNAPPVQARLAAIYGALERLVARRADVALCVSPDLSDRMRTLGATDVRRAVVAAPDLPAADPRPVELAAAGRPVVLGVGRLAPQKGFGTLLAAAASWRGRQPAPLVVIAGSGPLADDLARQAREREVDTTFLGARDDVAGLLAAADVFVLPSRWEGQPLVLQEALRAGRPIVATDVGGVRDLTGDDAALLVPAGDPAALSRAVLAVLDDPDLAGTLAKAALSRAASLPTEADAAAAALRLYRHLATARSS